jgi:hypothetical protein
VADNVDVGQEVLKLLVPDHTLLKLGLTNDCPFKVKRLTNLLLDNAVIVLVGN